MIDSRAVIDPKAELAENVSVGAFSVIGPDVQIDAGTVIGPHVVISGPARIGKDNHIYQFASIAEDPQDKKYAGEKTGLVIGNNNRIREFTTISRGTAQDAVDTCIGDNNLLMAYTHVAHDCQLGNDIIMANAASLGGHVKVQDHAILGGFSIVHQFCRVGAHSFSAMGSVVTQDVPPFVTIGGHPATPHGTNNEGLRRRGFSDEFLSALKKAYRLLYKSNLKLEQAHEQILQLQQDQNELAILAEFLAEDGRGIVR